MDVAGVPDVLHFALDSEKVNNFEFVGVMMPAMGCMQIIVYRFKLCRGSIYRMDITVQLWVILVDFALVRLRWLQ